MSNCTFVETGSLPPKPSDNDNRMTFKWWGPDNIYREYFVNQRTLKGYNTAEELKAALDFWTQQSFGYVITNVWFHKNRNGTWAVATGLTPPDVWPEDEIL